ncbi:MAG: nitrophenyl compound nitroreductase subunit ArsF family protein [Bacteroidota bacterium]|nr:nitrophenyl compound nitroreductase subunit ArsF family protein [Bacteroidota bacterium]
MKKLLFISLAIILTLGTMSCSAQTKDKKKSVTSISKKVIVYYFHFTQRCNTCHAVEDNSKKAVEILYASQVKKGEYAFEGYNLDEAKSKELGKKLGVEGQTLLVTCGNKKEDITSQGFMYAHDFDKLKAEIKKAVDKVK